MSQEQQFTNILRSLDNTLSRCNDTLNQQGISTIVGVYNGETGSVRDWISALQKFGDIHNFNDAQKINAAYLASTKAVEDFIGRWKTATPVELQKWETLSEDLLVHFGLVIDSSHAFELLRNLRQNVNESTSLFAERIFRLSKEAYCKGEMNNPATAKLAQRQLVNYFIDGLRDRSVRLKIMRHNPENLSDALKVARDEINLIKRFELCSRRFDRDTGVRLNQNEVEPMDVSQIRTRSCHKCGRMGHLARNCNQNKHINRQTVNAINQRPLLKCYECGSTAHLIRHCPIKWERERNGRMQYNPKRNFNMENNFRHRFNSKEN